MSNQNKTEDSSRLQLVDMDKDIVWEVENPKIFRRTDFRSKKKNSKRDKVKEKVSKKWKIKPHSSNEGDLFTELMNKLKMLDPGKCADITENIVLAILLRTRKTKLQAVLLIIAKIMKTHLGFTASNLLNKIIEAKNLICFKFLYDWTIGDIENYLKELLTNWKIASKNEAFGSIISLLSALAAIIYGADKKWSFTLGSFTLFMIDSRNACKGATGLVDAILKVVTYIISGLKTYTTTGSLASFLYADDQLAEFDATVSKLKAQMSLLQPGNLQRCADSDENAFDKELQLAITSGEKLISLYDGNTKKYVMDKVRLLKQLHADFIQFRAAGGLRIAPYAYLLSGSTGLGKSSLNEILMRYILAENGYNHTDPYICTLNSQDKFFSTYRSYVNGIIFDDFANVRKEFVQESPCETLLKFVNNIPFYLNMAEIELKGKVVAEPKVVGITTNVSDIDSSVYSNQASSIMRRMKVHIYAEVKKDFQKPGTIEIDPTKVYEKFGDTLAPDIWTFKVMTVKVTALSRHPKMKDNDCEGHCDDRWRLEYVKFNGKDMDGVTISELLLYIKKATNIHYREQVQLIERSKKYNGTIVCSECRAFFEHCTCIQENEINGTIHEIHSCDSKISDLLDHAISEQARVTDLLESALSDKVPSKYEVEQNRVSNRLKEIKESRNIQPHSTSEKIYDGLYDLRKYQFSDSLRDMLMSWVVEGKCNLNTFTEKFISNCNKEIQYFLIVIRNICQRWLQKNRYTIMELCFPCSLDGTRCGDYFTIVMRSRTHSAVSLLSCAVSYVVHIGITIFSLNVCQRNTGMGFISALIGHYVAKDMDFPSYVMQFVAFIKWYHTGISNFAENYSRLFWCLWIPAISAYYNSSIEPEKRKLVQGTFCFIFAASLMFKSFGDIWTKQAPRAISNYYRDKKQGLNNDWQLLLPSCIAFTTVYYSKEHIMDFYADAWESWIMSPQSRLSPNPSEIEERDKKHRFDAEWFNTQSETFLDALPTSKIITSNELRNNVEDNTWFIKNIETNAQSNCFVMCSGCILIPWHFVPKSINKFLFVKHNRGNSGNKQFIAVIDPTQCLRVGHLDLAMMWQPKTRDVKNLIDYFPLSVHESLEQRTGSIFTRNEDGDLVEEGIKELNYTLGATSGLGFFFPGIRYFWKGAKKGKCMSPVITDDKRACISGFHIGGSEQIRSDGCFLAYGVTPTQDILIETKLKLEQKPTIIPMSSSGDFHKEVMGVKVLQRCIKKKSCYLRMKAYNCAQFLGSSYNCNRTPKSKVRDTPIKDEVKKLFNLDLEWGSPMFKGSDGYSPYEPWEIGMEKWVVDRPGVPFGLLNRSKIEYVNALTRVLYDNIDYWRSEVKVLSWDEVVNGIPGKRFIDSMNFKSSIGFPFKGSKKLFSQNLGDTGEGWKDKRILNQEFIEEADKIILIYKKGQRYYPWFTTTLKDEPTLVGKSKVRVFQASSTPFQLVVRKYTLGICRFLQMNPLVSECAVGIDPCSSEWNELYSHLNGMQTYLYNRWFAIDYKVYDTSISSQLILCIGRIFVDLARVINYSDEDIAVLHSIFTELSFSVVDFNGDVLMLDGANPSGNPLTVFINNITNSLLMRIYFYNLYPRYTFRDHVRMMGYGDDLIASVRATVGYFNMIGYANYMKDYGFLVTPAVKDAQLTAYVGVEEVDFLKRKFVWDADYGAVIAPLEEASIYKRLCNYMSSDTDVNIIVGANIDGALDEWAFYGKSVYLEKQIKLQYIVNEFRLQRFVSRLHYTYEQRIALWREHNADPAVMGKGQGMDTGEVNCDNNFLGFFGWGNIISKIGIGGPPSSHNSESLSSNDCSSINQWTNEIKIEGQMEPISPLSVGEPKTYEWDVIPHSTFSVVKQEVMEMNDGSSNQILEIPNSFDETRMANDASDNSLGAFLSRPIKISSFDWSPSLTPLLDINPWEEFLANKRVVNRVANYKLIRAKMKVKFLINGNSFFYGRLMVSYLPYFDYDLMTNAGLEEINNVQFSQMPRTFLDPTTSQGSEMTLPFFWHKDYLNMLGDEVTKVGRLFIRQLVPLKHTSGDVTIDSKVTVTVYAWMEDVQLEAPTQTNQDYIVPQSTSGNDEHTTETGPITRIATAIQAAAKVGSGVPALAPYCMPAMWGAKMVAAGSSSLGWCSPSLIEEPKFIEPRGVGSTTLANVPDGCGKLTLDAKQEITVDPRTVGLGVDDELSIRYIAARESWLTRFTWALDAPREQLLFNLRVDPCQFNFLPGPDSYHITASCGASLPFKYWNGTFKMRLQFVTSAFHRGRVAVVYDPQSTAVVREDNVVYTHLIDISSCRDVTFTVGPNQDKPLLMHSVPGVEVVDDMWDVDTELGFSPLGNGTIAIYVLNELTIPNSDSTVNNDISVNVFTSMHDDFEVFVPHNDYINYTIKPQSSGVDTVTDVPDHVEESDPYNSPLLSMDLPHSVIPKRNLVYSGEKIESFRMVLKRYFPWGAVKINAPTGYNSARISHRIFPAYKGSVAGAVHTSVDGPFNYFQTTMLNWLLPAFQGWRGSIRYKWYPRLIALSSTGYGNNYVSFQQDAQYSYTDITYDTTTPSSTARSFSFGSGLEEKSTGALTFVQYINPVIEYEIPWYSDIRFSPGKTVDWTSLEALEAVPIGSVLYIDNIDGTSDSVYDVFTSAGEDFSCYYFTGWPPLYYLPVVPLSA